jgi:hemerythrin superfamily protein
MNATELLKQDHREVDSLIAELEGASDETAVAGAGSYTATFEKLKQSLTVHADAEEQILYPAMEQFDETEELTEEAYSEHDDVRMLLDEMTGLNPGDREFQDLLAQLKDSVQHHVEEEENEMFPRAEKLLGEETLETMGDEIEAMKTEAAAAAAGTGNTGGASHIASA